MPIIPCPECSSEVSDQANACPRCAFPIRTTQVKSIESLPTIVADSTRSQSSTEYNPVVPPREVRAGGLLLGLAMVGGAAYFLFSYLPAHDPANMSLGDALGALVGQQKYFSAEAIGPLTFVGWTCLVLGVVQLLTGSTKRDGQLGFCKACQRQVVAKKAFIGHECERCGRKV